MTSATRWSRFSPGSVLAMAVVSSLLLGLVALCCCAGEHVVAHTSARTAVTISDPGDGSLVDADPGHSDDGRSDDGRSDDGRTDDGCDRSADQPVAIVASATALTRDLVAAVALEPLRTDEVADRPVVDGGGSPARAPVSHLLCVLRV